MSLGSHLFFGSLDVRATKINEAMKMAAVKALAELAKEPVPEQVNVALERLNYSLVVIILFQSLLIHDSLPPYSSCGQSR